MITQQPMAGFAGLVEPITYTDALGTVRPVPAPVPVDSDAETLAERFEVFHAANPHVFQALRQMALRASRSGQRVGVKTLYEALRWHWLSSTAGDAFKLNNSFTAFYARLLMDAEPELAGYFETRVQRAVEV